MLINHYNIYLYKFIQAVVVHRPPPYPLTRKKCPPAMISRAEHTICSGVQGSPRWLLFMLKIGVTMPMRRRTLSLENLYLALNSRGLGISARGSARRLRQTGFRRGKSLSYSSRISRKSIASIL